ncbi:MAG: fumarylacetoacetate hydrolase family protein, partial [Roseovarius confluentis]
MRFVRYGAPGREQPGMLDAEGRVRDLSGVMAEISGAALGALPKLDPEKLPLVDGTPRLGPPVAGIGKLIGIGLNYSDHAAEIGIEPPAEPVVFMKATSSIVGPDDDVVLPRGSTHADW